MLSSADIRRARRKAASAGDTSAAEYGNIDTSELTSPQWGNETLKQYGNAVFNSSDEETRDNQKSQPYYDQKGQFASINPYVDQETCTVPNIESSFHRRLRDLSKSTSGSFEAKKVEESPSLDFYNSENVDNIKHSDDSDILKDSNWLRPPTLLGQDQKSSSSPDLSQLSLKMRSSSSPAPHINGSKANKTKAAPKRRSKSSKLEPTYKESPLQIDYRSARSTPDLLANKERVSTVSPSKQRVDTAKSFQSEHRKPYHMDGAISGNKLDDTTSETASLSNNNNWPSAQERRRREAQRSGNKVSGPLQEISPPTSGTTSNRSSRTNTIIKNAWASGSNDSVKAETSAAAVAAAAEGETRTRILSETELEEIGKAFDTIKNPHQILDDVYNCRYDQLTASDNGHLSTLLEGANSSELPTSLPKLELHSNAIDRFPFFNEAISGGNTVTGVDASKNVTATSLNVLKKDLESPNNSRAPSVVHRPNSISKSETERSDSTRSKTGLSKKRRKIRASHIFLILFAILFVVAISVFIPLIAILYHGTKSSFYRYFGKQSAQNKAVLLEDLGNKYNQELRNSSVGLYHGIPYNMSILDTPRKSPYQAPYLLGNYYSTLNTYDGLAEPFNKDKEFISLMDNKELKNVFYGVDYAPMNVLYPTCGAKERDVMLDLALLSQITSRIRTYGMQCDQQKLILDSFQKLNLNMTLALGVWIGNDEKINDQQLMAMKSVLTEYPRKYFDSIYVGNEVLFREEKKAMELAKYIKEVRQFIAQKLNWTDLPVGVSEIGSKIHPDIIEAADMVGANIHPFFGGDSVSNATDWVFDFLDQQVLPLNKKTKSPAQMVISEVGWPYGGGRYLSSVAGKDEMQEFIDSWVCRAQKCEYPWFWFEAFDEPWKSVYHTKDRTWETQWGIFTADRRLKNGITLPDCDKLK